LLVTNCSSVWQPELDYVIVDVGETNFLEEIANSFGENGGFSAGILSRFWF
jgi:hypothetical protein